MDGNFWVEKFYIGKTMPTAPVMVNERVMYYAGVNTNELVKYDIKSKKILEKVYIPEKEKCAHLIKGMYIYENFVYMVPGRGSCVYIYNIDKKYFETIGNKYLKHRKCNENIKKSICYNNYIWCLCENEHIILKIDMKNKEIYEIDFSHMKCSSDLVEMQRWEDNIYISGRESGCGLVINIHNDEIKIWEAGKNLEYFDIVDGYVYYLVCEDDKCSIYKRNIFSGCSYLEKEVCLSEKINKNAFKYVMRYGSKLFFLPYKSAYIIMYDLDAKAVKVVKLDICILNNLVGKKIGVNDYVSSLLKIDNGYMAVMSYKPCIVYLDINFEINDIFEEDIDMEICNEAQRADEVMYELVLSGYDNLVEANKNRYIIGEKLFLVGEKIHKYIINL